jgi:carbamoyltransferase|tara:strand:+ start:27647 stop:29275 length:1629 start_codon:yes stop_codon:yes gene_type:complete
MIIVGIYGAYNWDANLSELTNDDASVTFMHDGGCTLFIDGKHICSINEERITRTKYDGNYPHNAITHCLTVGNISSDDVDIVYSVASHHHIALNQLENHTAYNMLQRSFSKAKIRFVGHHLSHAASSVFTSPFNEGSFLTFDGGGSAIHDDYRRTLDQIENNSIGYFNKSERIFRFYNMPEDKYNNFGQLYSAAASQIYAVKTGKGISDWNTQISTVGKVMGLSAYGSDVGLECPYKITNHSIPYINYKSDWFNDEITPEDAAYFLQKSFEDGIVEFLSILRKYHLTENVCFAGGTFLNILANTKIKQSGIFDKIHIPPFPDDSGIHFGAAIWGCFEEGEDISVPENLALLGKEYSDSEILKVLDLFQLSYTPYDSEQVAQKINNNKIVAWFQGRSEHGPRALGSRSILMSPTKAENKDILNKRVKHREYWRPFAGIVQEEKVSEYFNEGFKTPYMLYTQTVKDDRLLAIKHEDGTCRIQTINKDCNPRMHTLLSHLDPPVVVNTSFNDNGQPIVESPYHAVKSFLSMDIDTLVIGDYIVDK